jgi:hypothetical protein
VVAESLGLPIAQNCKEFQIFGNWISFIPLMAITVGGYCKIENLQFLPLHFCCWILLVWFDAFELHFLSCLSFKSLYEFLQYLFKFSSYLPLTKPDVRCIYGLRYDYRDTVLSD